MANIERTERFKDAEWYSEKKRPVLVGGCGGIGSWLTLLLSRANMQPYVYDFDTMEGINMAGQLYGKKHIGMPKVEALYEVVKEFCDEELDIFNEEITEDTMSNHYVFSAFDNMKARKILFDKWVESNVGKGPAIFIDGRLLMEQMQIFCVKNNPEDIERYKKYLFGDSEVEDAPCTAKQTSTSAAMIASHMVMYFTNHLVNVKTNSIKRSVPFYWEMFMPLDMISYKPEEEEQTNGE